MILITKMGTFDLVHLNPAEARNNRIMTDQSNVAHSSPPRHVRIDYHRCHVVGYIWHLPVRSVPQRKDDD